MTEAEFPNAPPVGICRTVWSGASSAVKDFCPMRSQRSGASRRRKYAWIVPPAAGRIRWSAPEHAATDTFTVDAVLAVLAKQKVKCGRDQAERVAWRILKDWVAAQMAILESEMVQMDEVFLPYMVNDSGQTLFQCYKNKQLAIGGY